MEKIAFKYGIYMFFGFITIFIFMHVLGLSANYYFRLFNGAVEALFIWFALHARLRNHVYDARETLSNYPGNVALGLLTSTIGVVPFAICISIYLSLNNDFMIQLQQASKIGEYLNPFTAGLILIAEGTIFSLIVSYILARALEQQKFPD